MPPGPTIADYLDGIRYRRYSRSVLLERRRLLALAAVCGDEPWFGTTPIDEVVATVTARLALESPTTLQRLGAAVRDYQAWRRRYAAQEGGT
jgi:hypothetical protein